MKITARYGVFETNSSSVHAFAYLDPAAYADFKSGKSIILFEAIKDDWDGFYHLDEMAPTVTRMGQEYADLSENVYDFAALQEKLAALEYDYGYYGDQNAIDSGFMTLSGKDLQGGQPSQDWIDGVSEHGFYSFRDMIVSEDRRGGVTIAAEFHD